VKKMFPALLHINSTVKFIEQGAMSHTVLLQRVCSFTDRFTANPGGGRSSPFHLYRKGNF
jgi:hypothetical protein